MNKRNYGGLLSDILDSNFNNMISSESTEDERYINVNFMTEVVYKNKKEKEILNFIKSMGEKVIEYDLFDEIHKRKDLNELAEQLEKNQAILYLKNYTSVPFDYRIRFNAIFKDRLFVKKATVLRYDLKYMGTIILTTDEDEFPLIAEEPICFKNIEV